MSNEKLFKGKIKRHSKTGRWIPQPGSMGKHLDAIQLCNDMNDIDEHRSMVKGLSIDEYQRSIRDEKG